MTPPPERVAEVEDVVRRVATWASTRPAIVGVLLVGSWARGAARGDSDVDFIVLTTAPSHDDRVEALERLRLGQSIRSRSWGVVDEHRFLTAMGLEVELNLAAPAWARPDPVDPGTYDVVSHGAVILYDPHGQLDTLCRACRRGKDPAR